jgi:hypothetical protein
VSAIKALAAAKAAGVRLKLDGDGIVLEVEVPPLPADIVALLKAAKPDLMKILEWREAARAAVHATPPEDCGSARPVLGVSRWTTYDQHGRETLHAATYHGPPESRWEHAMRGLRRFVGEGWGDQACLFGWSKEELYRVPAFWSQIHLTGAALLICDRRVIAVTSDNIVIRTSAGSELRFRRIGREHLA